MLTSRPCAAPDHYGGGRNINDILPRVDDEALNSTRAACAASHPPNRRLQENRRLQKNRRLQNSTEDRYASLRN